MRSIKLLIYRIFGLTPKSPEPPEEEEAGSGLPDKAQELLEYGPDKVRVPPNAPKHLMVVLPVVWEVSRLLRLILVMLVLILAKQVLGELAPEVMQLLSRGG